MAITRYFNDHSLGTKTWAALGAGLAFLLLLSTAACGGNEPAVQSTVLPRKTPTTGVTRPAQPTPPAQSATKLVGQLDPTFGTGGKVTTDFGSTLEEAHGVVVQHDGKIVAAGSSRVGSHETMTLARYDAKGQLDPTFGDGGKVIPNLTGTDNDYSAALALVQQPDGKLVAAGWAYSTTVHHDVFVVARYNADGTLDAGFGDGGKTLTAFKDELNSSATDHAQAVALAPDGKIVLAGVTGMYPPDFGVVRYNADGSLDITFGDGGKATTDFGNDDEAQAVAVQPDGKILAAGFGGTQNGNQYQDYALARYNTDGSLDSTFGQGGKVMTDFGSGQDWAAAIVLRPDGKIVLAGPVVAGAMFCGSDACEAFGFGLAQYNPDGSLDTHFGNKGLAAHTVNTSEGNYALLRLPDGKLATAGHANNSVFSLVLYNADGSVDTSFGKKGQVTTDFTSTSTDRIYALALQPDGKIVAAGTAGVDPNDILNADFGLVRYR